MSDYADWTDPAPKTSVTACRYCQGTSLRHTHNCPTQGVRSGSAPPMGSATTATDGTTGSATTEALLDERETTHGSFANNARIAQGLRRLLHAEPNWQLLDDEEREALDYDIGKTSRILSAPRATPAQKLQHWEDKAGYATLVMKHLRRNHA